MNLMISKVLDELIMYLPQVKQALGEDWPAFAKQMQAQAASFEEIKDEAALDKEANKLYALFLDNDKACAIITSGDVPEDPRGKPNLNPQKPPEKLETIANRFYLLCQDPDNPDRAKAIQPDDEADTSLPEKQDA